MLSNIVNIAKTGTDALNRGKGMLSDGANSTASASALLTNLMPGNVGDAEANAATLPVAAQESAAAQESSVEQALCSHLKSIFEVNSPKFGEMMIKTIGHHLTEEKAIKDGVNTAVVNALTPKITEAVNAAMNKLSDVENPDGIYSILKKKIDAAFDTDIRASVFDNINVLSKDALVGMVEKLNIQNNAATKATLTAPKPEPVPVETPAEPEPATAEAAPIVEDVSVDGNTTKGGKKRTRKARRRAAKKAGGATKRRRQRILTLA